MTQEAKVKHLELIQSVISRLAGNSFLIKGWTVTLALAGFGIFAESHKLVFLLLVILSVLLFWSLDAYYLRQEKLFRSLYDDCVDSYVKNKIGRVNVLSMNVTKYQKKVPNVVYIMFTLPTILLYALIIIVAGLLYYD